MKSLPAAKKDRNFVRPFCVGVFPFGHREQSVAPRAKKGEKGEGRKPSSFCRAVVLVSPSGSEAEREGAS
jgi:hypothetical protein